LLELRDKLDLSLGAVVGGAGTALASRDSDDILNALLSLGYNDREASWAIKQLPTGVAVSDGIRQALKLLSKEK
jgi:Holliday junction DNA helicase RuvA